MSYTQHPKPAQLELSLMRMTICPGRTSTRSSCLTRDGTTFLQRPLLLISITQLAEFARTRGLVEERPQLMSSNGPTRIRWPRFFSQRSDYTPPPPHPPQIAELLDHILGLERVRGGRRTGLVDPRGSDGHRPIRGCSVLPGSRSTGQLDGLDRAVPRYGHRFPHPSASISRSRLISDAFWTTNRKCRGP